MDLLGWLDFIESKIFHYRQCRPVAELSAMASGEPKPFPTDPWAEHQWHIEHAIRGVAPQLTGKAYDEVLRTIKDRLVPNQAADDVSELVRQVATQYVEQKRQELWQAHRPRILSRIQEMFPPAVQEFESHYSSALLDLVFNRLIGTYPESWPEENFDERLAKIVSEVVPRAIAKLVNDKGELRDEELVSLSRAGFPQCKTRLLERYAALLNGLAAAVIHGKNICPESEDPIEFAKDVAQEVSIKLLENLDSFRFESSFKTWVGTIIENEANTKQRKLLGRSKQGKRRYVSFEELQQQSTMPVIHDLERREILRKAFDKHREGGVHNRKSAFFIELRYFEDMDPSEIAMRQGTTTAYVYRLFSDDYPEIRRICIEDFGMSGTDL